MPPDDLPLDADASLDVVSEPDELAHQRWVDVVIVVGFVVVMIVVALAFWLSVQSGGEGCAPVHQALGHC